MLSEADDGPARWGAAHPLESSYPADGFMTALGKIIPFYGNTGSYVVVEGVHWLTPAEARVLAAALLTLADAVDTETSHKRNRRQ